MKMMKKQSKGFTLLEIMVVMLILGLLGTIVAVNLLDNVDEARQTKARTDVVALKNALTRYKLHNYSYPTQEQGLQALVRKPTARPEPKNYPKNGYIDKLPEDPWGEQYQYIVPGKRGGDFDLFSMGQDRQIGGQGEGADIGNWDDADVQL